MSVEQRLAALEAEVIRLRQDLTETRTLAAHADRDVAEFRGEVRQQTEMINLTRLDIGGLGARMGGVEDILRSVATLLERQEEKLERQEEKIDRLIGRSGGGES